MIWKREQISSCAFIFQAIELSNENNGIGASMSSESHAVHSISQNVTTLRSSTLHELWKLTETHNIFNRSQWRVDVATSLLQHQQDMVGLIKDGYEEQTLEEKWSFPAALMFTLRFAL